MIIASYEAMAKRSDAVSRSAADIVGDRPFATDRRWLPARLSDVGRISCLSDAEKIKLTHVEMGAYAHLLGYLEALTSFGAEGVGHLPLFRAVRERVDETLGFRLALLPGAADVAPRALDKHAGAVLLLRAAFESLTAFNHAACFGADERLDPLSRRIFEHHAAEQSRNARSTRTETRREFSTMSAAETDLAVDDLIDLVGLVHELLQQQAGLDVRNLERYLGRTLGGPDRREILAAVLRAKRHAFIENGITHPDFQDLLGTVLTPAQQERLRWALSAALAPG